jgi:hypothetical protein
VAQVEAQFNAFKQEVIEKTWDHPAGCESGKREFLRDLGLQAPKQDARYQVELWVQTSDEDATETELWDVLSDALQDKGYDFNIDSIEFVEYTD